MAYHYLMNISSAIFFICYIPELYANYKNKNANIYNVPEKVLMVIGTGFAFSFSVLNDDVSLMANYGPILALDVIALLMRVYYVYINHNKDIILPLAQDDSESRTATSSPELSHTVHTIPSDSSI
jgi:hypothetical protein